MAAIASAVRLVEEAQDLASHMLPPRLLVIHDTSRSCQDNVAELTRRQELDDPLLHIAELNVVSGADDAGLVQPESRVSSQLSRGVQW